MNMQRLDCNSLTLHNRGFLVIQQYVELEKELGGTLQESLKQFEHAQISSQAKQRVVLLTPLLHRAALWRHPNYLKALFQQVVIPSNSDTVKTQSNRFLQTTHCICHSFIICMCNRDVQYL